MEMERELPGFAKAALLQTYHIEDRLLATVDRIAPDTAPRSHARIKEQRTNLIGISPSKAKNVAFRHPTGGISKLKAKRQAV